MSHTAILTWYPSTGAIIASYNVYRASTSGGPYEKMNSHNNPTFIFVDSSVQSGQTYYYAVTAQDINGLESGYSNQVKAIIPTP